jgi:hypothetical protein
MFAAEDHNISHITNASFLLRATILTHVKIACLLYLSIGPPASFQAAMPPWMWQADVMPAS